MGNRPSQSVTKSPSAAYGRLRIDSPGPRRSPHRNRAANRRPSSGMSMENLPVSASGTSSSSYGASSNGKLKLMVPPQNVGASTATEQSSLLLSSSTDRYLSSSLPSDAAEIPVTPLYVWIGPALVCALCYALYNIFIKKGSASIHPVLGGVILQFVAAILGSFLLGMLVWKDGGVEALQYDWEGIQWAILAGASVGAAEILSFIVSGMGVQAMQSIPIIIGGSVLFGTILGFAVLQEVLSYRGWIGVGLIAGGIALVGIDPGGG